MKLETVRLLKAAAADVTNGINAKVAAVPIDTGDVRPVSLNGPYTDVDNKWVARRKLNTEDSAAVTLPALAMFQFAPLRAIDPEVHTIIRDVHLQLALAVIMKKGDAANATRDALYYNRALLQFLNWLMQNAQSSTFRLKNNIQIRSIDDLTQDEVEEDWDAASVLAATIVTFRVRELSP